jgi:hypothetical protein
MQHGFECIHAISTQATVKKSPLPRLPSAHSESMLDLNMRIAHKQAGTCREDLEAGPAFRNAKVNLAFKRFHSQGVCSRACDLMM